MEVKNYHGGRRRAGEMMVKAREDHVADAVSVVVGCGTYRGPQANSLSKESLAWHRHSAGTFQQYHYIGNIGGGAVTR